MKLTLRERFFLFVAAVLAGAALLLLRARLRLDLSRAGGKTARPGRRDSMTAEEVRAFAARHGVRYPFAPDREKPGELGVVVRPLEPGEDEATLSLAALEAMACPVVADARRAFAEAREGVAEAPPPDPHARAPGDFSAEDCELAAA